MIGYHAWNMFTEVKVRIICEYLQRFFEENIGRKTKFYNVDF